MVVIQGEHFELGNAFERVLRDALYLVIRQKEALQVRQSKRSRRDSGQCVVRKIQMLQMLQLGKRRNLGNLIVFQVERFCCDRNVFNVNRLQAQGGAVNPLFVAVALASARTLGNAATLDVTSFIPRASEKLKRKVQNRKVRQAGRLVAFRRRDRNLPLLLKLFF